MDRTSFERVSVRTALALGLCVTASLWIYTGYSVAVTMNGVRDRASAATARYSQAQQLLATIRTHLLLSSVRVRDSLLASDHQAIAASRADVEESYRIIAMAIEDYEPVVRSASETEQFSRLHAEIERFHQASTRVLGDGAGRTRRAIRDALNRQLMPPREAALLISEQIQELNRQAYIGLQSDIAAIYRAAELTSRRQLGIALALSLMVLLLTGAYAGKLDSRLQMQLKRDIRMSLDLHATVTQLADAQADERRAIARQLACQVGEPLSAIQAELSAALRAAQAGGDTVVPIAAAHAITVRAMRDLSALEQ